MDLETKFAMAFIVCDMILTVITGIFGLTITPIVLLILAIPGALIIYIWLHYEYTGERLTLKQAITNFLPKFFGGDKT